MNSLISIGLDSVEIPVGDDIFILIADSKRRNPAKDLCEIPGLPPVWRGKLSASKVAPINFHINSLQYGVEQLSFYEVQRYFWMVTSRSKIKNLKNIEVTSSLSQGNKAEWICRDLFDSPPNGEFSVHNYLGTAWIKVSGYDDFIRFDILTPKLDFISEYQSMVEFIADYCQQLLLEWSSPTSLNLIVDSAKRKQILLEQFLFLRNIFAEDKLDLYLETIQRNPHRILENEMKWFPAGVKTADRFFTDPLKHSRGWEESDLSNFMVFDGFVPGEILSSRKYDSFDTIPNRFIKYTLQYFRELCEAVVFYFTEENNGGTAVIEASGMRDALDGFLSNKFFKNIGAISRIPYENQIVLKREGYKQIFRAWLLLDAASKLDWHGREDAYDGTNRNVAVFYEYWLFFILNQILIEDLKAKELNKFTNNSHPELKPFLVKTKNSLTINLKQGKTSLRIYKWDTAAKDPLVIHFYYNKVFSSATKSVFTTGTYTRPLRPDYSFVIFPDKYAIELGANYHKNPTIGESNAEADGRIAYLHFDAKFRVERLEQIFGRDLSSNAENSSITEVEDELNREHMEISTMNTYNRGDLYKMHTYNDAIRRSIGSYVIYPGTDNEPSTYPRYHEIIPGVGAFTLKPQSGEEGPEAVGREQVANFIKDLLSAQQNKFSQSYRMNYWTHDTIKEKPADYLSTALTLENERSPDDIKLMLGFMRSEEICSILEKEKMFYFHAIEDSGKITKLDPRSLKADYILPYIKFKGVGWYAKIMECVLIKKEVLIERLTRHSDNISLTAAYYYLLELDNIMKINKLNLEAHIKHLGPKRPPVIIKWSDLFKHRQK
jgi:predicted component of viral defense system (DUF524 family)